jgi:hypothetical protein
MSSSGSASGGSSSDSKASVPPDVELAEQALGLSFHPTYNIVAASLINGQIQL